MISVSSTHSENIVDEQIRLKQNRKKSKSNYSTIILTKQYCLHTDTYFHQNFYIGHKIKQ